jgi:hypothetical protein
VIRNLTLSIFKNYRSCRTVCSYVSSRETNSSEKKSRSYRVAHKLGRGGGTHLSHPTAPEDALYAQFGHCLVQYDGADDPHPEPGQYPFQRLHRHKYRCASDETHNKIEMKKAKKKGALRRVLDWL